MISLILFFEAATNLISHIILSFLFSLRDGVFRVRQFVDVCGVRDYDDYGYSTLKFRHFLGHFLVFLQVDFPGLRF